MKERLLLKISGSSSPVPAAGECINVSDLRQYIASQQEKVKSLYQVSFSLCLKPPSSSF